MNYPDILFAQAARESSVLEMILRPETLVFMIPITAIVGGVAFAITKAIIAHRERMARIQQGIDPDERPGAQ
jgi:ABC-type enterobactin transport system permease subunit